MIFIFILIPIILILAAQWYAYQVAFFSPRSTRAEANAPLVGDQYQTVADNIGRISGIMQRIPYEEVTIQSRDGLRLYGRYYHLRDGAPVEILFHGYRSHPFRDCSGGHALARKMGFNTLVVDQRAHGRSGGHTITFGIKERFDCLCWINYVNDRFGHDTPIVLSGLSMGAATVLMSLSLNLPENVTCVMADSPYSSPTAIIEKVCLDRHYPLALCRPFLHLGAITFGRFHLDSCSATEAVRNARIPVLLIHGEDDRFVPCNMSLEIAANCASAVEVSTFPGAGHGLSYMTDPVRYEKVAFCFLSRIPALKDAIDPEYIKKLYEIYTD